MYIEALDLRQLSDYKKLSDFLVPFGLELDLVDGAYVLYDQRKWVGCGCKYRNVLKNFAIAPEYQSQQLLEPLLQHVKEEAFKQGYLKTFIYTPKSNKALFESLYYRLIVEDDEVCLLENGHPSFEDVMKSYETNKRGVTGAIVVNANPFTFGHQHLIEYASSRVEALDVFVVEEEASLFSFQTRMQLVKEGVTHLSNVTILPSSEYMVSRATFPTYFLKDEKRVNRHHAQLDALLFAQGFVSSRHITTRFFGEEPKDITTKNYMDICAKILPEHGCNVVIIPRISADETLISATTVREGWKRKDWALLEKLVPSSTLAYLTSHEYP